MNERGMVTKKICCTGHHREEKREIPNWNHIKLIMEVKDGDWETDYCRD
jgi:hypothetical protein